MTNQTNTHMPNQVGFKQPEAEEFPAVILVASASPCNLQCPGCPCTHIDEIRDTRNEFGKLEPYFKKEWYEALADECAEHITDSFVPRIRISGYGEPFLNKELVPMIEYSCSKGIPTSLISNGLLMTEDKVKGLLEAGIESIEISVDAHEPELYKKIRVGGDFETLTKKVEMLLRLRNEIKSDKRTFILVSVVDSPDNHEVIDDIRSFWLDLGVDHVSVRKFLTWGVPVLSDMRKDLKTEDYMQSDAPCPYPYERIMVDPAGWIRLCPYDDQKKIPDFGHLMKTPIKEVWKGLRMGKIRACHKSSFNAELSEKDAPLCHGCEDRRNRSWNHNYIKIANEHK